ncbi:hypothetical protein ACM64Y_01900 [Novispirillum sp. DQ9]|uniref:hypothetical protein n=1 Tax=Novispirillum sp. DQ9 TaxID=3398612 RepID=UPI003C7E9743
MSRNLLNVLRTLLVLVLTLPALASCYVPDDFLAEIRLARNGDYALIYRGKLTWAPLWADIRGGKLSPEEVAEKEAAVMADLQRDGHFSAIKPLGRGQFEVAYERTGKFTGTRKVTFVRRSAEILSMELRTSGEVHIRTRNDPKLDLENQLAANGLSSRGKLRIITNAPVVLHNAQNIGEGLPGYPDYAIYDWSITATTKPMPMLVARL